MNTQLYLICLSGGWFSQIQCTLTSHELPARVQVLEAHMQGKKYRKLLAAKEIQIPDKFKEYIVEHTKKPYVW